MREVRSADSELEGQMLLNLLSRSGIEGQLVGSGLTSVAGELPAMGLVRVLVDDADVAAARQILDEWESQQPRVQEAAPKRSSRVAPFLLGLAIASGIAYLTTRTPWTTSGTDWNQDGVLEEQYFWEGNYLSRLEVDRNGDGEPDSKTYYSGDFVSYTEEDNDFDGFFETRYEYERNQLVSGHVDLRRVRGSRIEHYFENGVISSSRVIHSRSSDVRSVYNYDDFGELVSIEFDSDDDGIADKTLRFDEYARPQSGED